MTSLRLVTSNEQYPLPPSHNTFDELPLQAWPDQLYIPEPTQRLHLVTEEETGSQLYLPGDARAYRLGEPSLPVAPFREVFLDTVANNQVSIACSETGSGKTTQFPLYALEYGYPIVIVSQPQKVAARELMERARQNLGPYADLAGYLTGDAADSDCPPNARIVYATERILLNMARSGQLPQDALIINDEAHRRGVPTIVALAYLRDKVLPNRPDLRLVVSSATIDTEKFAKYLTGPGAEPAPVLTLPGRTFPSTRKESEDDVATIMRENAKRGNGLGFEPGIARIRATANAAMVKGSGHVVHTLYGSQSPRQQKAALTPEDGHHLVASGIAEVSLTPENKFFVADSGLRNHGTYNQGVRGIITITASQSELIQAAGRVSRMQPGEAWLSLRPADAPPQPTFDERPMYGVPEIENSSVASFIAELLTEGTRLEDLGMLEYPTSENLQHDYKVLQRLGGTALLNGQLSLTPIGEAMLQVPLSVPLARMVIESRQPVDNPEVDVEALRLQVAAAAAILEATGILDVRQGSQRRYYHRKGHQGVLSNEQTSDVLFALDVFIAMRNLQLELLVDGKPDPGERFENILEKNDILPNNYERALATYEEVCLREGLESLAIQKPTPANRERFIACQIAGAEEVFVRPRNRKEIYVDIRGDRRPLGRRTTIASQAASILVGVAFDIQGLSGKGPFKRKFIVGASAVTVEQLRENAPHRITEKSLGYGVNRRGQLVERQALYFDGNLEVAEVEAELPPTRETRIMMMHALMTGRAPSVKDSEQPVSFRPEGTPRAAAAIGQWRAAQKLQETSKVDLKVGDRYRKLIARTIRETLDQVPLDITDPAVLDAFIPNVYRSSLVRPTRKKDVPELIQRAPDAVKVLKSDGESMYLPVTYRANVAMVSIPRDMRKSIARTAFEGIEANFPVKVRIAKSKYLPIDAVFKMLDEERAADAEKRARREERRATAALRQDPSKPTRRELRDETAADIEVQLKQQAKAMMSRRPQKGLPDSARKRQVDNKARRLRKNHQAAGQLALA